MIRRIFISALALAAVGASADAFVPLDPNCISQGTQIGSVIGGSNADIFNMIQGALGGGGWEQGINCANGASELENTKVSTIVTAIMRGILVLVGIFAVIGFVVAGLIYIASAGNEDQIQRAKRTALYALIGIIVALAGLVIITAVERVLSGERTF